MLLSGIMLKMGAFALIVWLIPIVPLGWQLASKYVIILSVISVVYGSMMAITQHNFKRMLMVPSLGHVGLIAAGISHGICKVYKVRCIKCYHMV